MLFMFEVKKVSAFRRRINFPAAEGLKPVQKCRQIKFSRCTTRRDWATNSSNMPLCLSDWKCKCSCVELYCGECGVFGSRFCYTTDLYTTALGRSLLLTRRNFVKYRKCVSSHILMWKAVFSLCTELCLKILIQVTKWEFCWYSRSAFTFLGSSTYWRLISSQRNFRIYPSRSGHG